MEWGTGNVPAAAEFVIDVAEEAISTLPIDPARIYLVGYSNGAVGVTRAAIIRPDLFRGLVYVSPVTEDELLSSSEFLLHFKDRNILFVHGGRDKRIPRELVENTVSSLRGSGCTVQFEVYDDEDHSLILSQREAIADTIAAFMTAPSSP